MTGFSEYIQNFINVQSISLKDLSEETGIDRTVLYRYVKGKRIPSDKDIVIRIADAAQMSLNEKKYFLEEYDKVVLGDNIVYSYEYIKKMTENLGRFQENNTAKSSWHIVHDFEEEDKSIELNSSEEIITYILDLFKYAVLHSKDIKKILIVMQPVYDEIQKFIPQIFNDSEIEIEQIICMEQNINQNYRNLELLEKVLPLCFSHTGYRLYYYYDLLSSHINDTTVMPNIIIAGDYVVQFDYPMKHGFVERNTVFTRVMHRQYNLLQKNTSSLVSGTDGLDKFSFVYRNMGGDSGISMQKQFCMANCIDMEMAGRHIFQAGVAEEIIGKNFSVHGKWKGDKYVEEKDKNFFVISYGTHKGMEEFMETGRIKEFPDNLYSPLTLEERLEVLERMCMLIKKGKAEYHLILDGIEFADGIIYYLSTGKRRFIFSKVTKNDIMHVTVDEQSIYRTFKMYLEYLYKKGLVYNKEETLDYLEELKASHQLCGTKNIALKCCVP